MESQKKSFTLELDELQFETIRQLFSHSNWDFDNAIVGDNKTFQSEEESEQLQVQPLIETDAAAGPSHTGRPGGGDGDGDRGPPGGDDDDGNHNSSGDSDDSFDGCLHCFCDPCVTTHRQGWLGNAVRHNDRNPSLRKIRYKKFWTMLDRRQAWINPRYQRKKTRLFGRTEDSYVWSARDVMPDCVVNLVRSLFPNPPGRPYMGHLWQ